MCYPLPQALLRSFSSGSAYKHLDNPTLTIYLCSATDELTRSARLLELAVMEGYSERQEDEIEFLQAVFPAGEFEDLRLKDPWKVISEERRSMF